jgi:U1 small nuclear ribonucleoprotein C
MSVRKAHNSGRNHLRNVVDYYQRARILDRHETELTRGSEIGHEKAQSVIDSITNSYAAEGHANPNLMLHNPMGGPGIPPPFPFPGASTIDPTSAANKL